MTGSTGKGLRVSFWGTRGSIPTSLDGGRVRGKVLRAVQAALAKGLEPGGAEAFVDALPFADRSTYGGNTSCVEVSADHGRVILDAGTGLRECGNRIMASGSTGHEIHILLSHPHWDHIQGFPFFIPAYIPGNKVVVHSGHPDMKAVFTAQMSAPCFPVDLSAMGADIEFRRFKAGESFGVDGFQVRTNAQTHPGRSFGFRIEHGGKAVVYSTDCEHKVENTDELERFKEFISGADLLVFDAQYTCADAFISKEDWGHSHNLIGVELAMAANVGRLCLFHHEPASSDRQLDSFFADTLRYASLYNPGSALEVRMAHDGLVMDL